MQSEFTRISKQYCYPRKIMICGDRSVYANTVTIIKLYTRIKHLTVDM